jgi:hypothetical protein
MPAIDFAAVQQTHEQQIDNQLARISGRREVGSE